MGIFEQLQQDLANIQSLLIQQKNELDEIRRNLPEKVDKVLNLQEIKHRLGVKSYKGFYNRLQTLRNFGLYKSGGWKIKESDMIRYINTINNLKS